MQPHPHPWLGRLAATTLALGGLSILALVANLAVFSQLYPPTVALEPLPTWTDPAIGYVVGVGLLILGVFHVLAVVSLGWQVRVLQRATAGHAAILCLGILSLLFVMSNVALLGDIGKEYKAGLETQHEWTWVFVNHGVHLLFVVLAGAAVAHGRKVLRSGHVPEVAELDETVFLSTHYVGIFSGALGLAAMVLLVATGFPARFFGAGVGVFSIIFVTPWVVAAAGWGALARLRPHAAWTDEKQSLDLARAAGGTLLTVVPVLGLAYFFQTTVLPAELTQYLWFPVAGFATLLAFSSFTIWFSRRA